MSLHVVRGTGVWRSITMQHFSQDKPSGQPRYGLERQRCHQHTPSALPFKRGSEPFRCKR